jgi:hypothetical protein
MIQELMQSPACDPVCQIKRGGVTLLGTRTGGSRSTGTAGRV